MSAWGRQLRALFLQQFELDEDMLVPEMPVADLGIDSLELLEFCVELEYRFGIVVEEERLAACANLGEAVNYLSSLRAK